jgi:hypothetical protein
LSIKGKINFLQLLRFSTFCEQFFRIYFENRFNFQGFNLSLVSTLEIKESINPNTKKNKRIIRELMQWGKIAA